MTLSEEKGNTHTHTLTWFLLLLYLHLPLSRQQVFGEPWREVCMCVCESECVFILSFRLTCQTKPGSSVKVKTRRSTFRDRQEQQKRGREFCQVFFFLRFVSILTNAAADLCFSCVSKQLSHAFIQCEHLSISMGRFSTLQAVNPTLHSQLLLHHFNRQWCCRDGESEGLMALRDYQCVYMHLSNLVTVGFLK